MKTYEFAGFYISSEPMNDDTDVETFDAVEWVSLGGGTICFDEFQSTPSVSVKRQDSDRMRFIDAACDIDDNNNYGFKVVYACGTIDYLRGLIIHLGRDMTKIGDMDFAHVMYMLGLNQAPIRIDRKN